MLGDPLDGVKAAFGAALRELRVGRGYSQEALSLESGVKRNFISLIETGQNQPTISTIYKLAKALGLSASALIDATDDQLKKLHDPSP